MTPVRKPMSPAKSIRGMGTMPNSDSTLMTASEKKRPLLPAQRISPMRRSFTEMGAASMPS